MTKEELDDERWPFNDPRREPFLYRRERMYEYNEFHRIGNHPDVPVALTRPEGALTRTDLLMRYALGKLVLWSSFTAGPLVLVSPYRYIPDRKGYQDIPSTAGRLGQFGRESLNKQDPAAFFTAQRWYGVGSSSLQLYSYVDQNVLDDGKVNGYNDHFIFDHPCTEHQQHMAELLKDQLG